MNGMSSDTGKKWWKIPTIWARAFETWWSSNFLSLLQFYDATLAAEFIKRWGNGRTRWRGRRQEKRTKNTVEMELKSSTKKRWEEKTEKRTWRRRRWRWSRKNSNEKKTYRVERVSKLPSFHIDRLCFPSRASTLHRIRLWSPLEWHTYHMAGKICTPSPCLQEDSFHWYSVWHKNGRKCIPCAHYRVRLLHGRDHL